MEKLNFSDNFCKFISRIPWFFVSSDWPKQRWNATAVVIKLFWKRKT
jgi:hypothetical protein